MTESSGSPFCYPIQKLCAVISVITPVFNGEEHIETCLESVIAQRCNNVEHIIMDGQSSDNTMDIVKRYAEKYVHIRWQSQPDEGQSDAMNKGIDLALGDVLSILNVDDYYEPNTLNRVSALFETFTEPTFLVGNCNIWDSRGNLKSVNRPKKLGIADLLLGWQINPHPVNPAAYFYHKSLHDLCGEYDKDQHFTMDLDFILKVVQTAKTVYVDEIWGNYLFLEGTKTERDKREGTSNARYNAVLENHRQALGLASKLKILLLELFVVAPIELRKVIRRSRRAKGR